MSDQDYPTVAYPTIRNMFREIEIEYHKEYMDKTLSANKWMIYLGQFLMVERLAQVLGDREFLETVQVFIADMTPGLREVSA